MKTLDAHGDDYRNAQLTILLEVGLESNANVEKCYCFSLVSLLRSSNYSNKNHDAVLYPKKHLTW